MKDTEFAAEKIRAQYIQQPQTDLDALKALDAKVKRGANIFGYVYGNIGAIVMGAGMSLCMTELGDALGRLAMIIGISVGLVGMVPAALAYPIYNRVLKKERERIAPEILRMTENLLN